MEQLFFFFFIQFSLFQSLFFDFLLDRSLIHPFTPWHYLPSLSYFIYSLIFSFPFSNIILIQTHFPIRPPLWLHIIANLLQSSHYCQPLQSLLLVDYDFDYNIYEFNFLDLDFVTLIMGYDFSNLVRNAYGFCALNFGFCGFFFTRMILKFFIFDFPSLCDLLDFLFIM